MPTFTRKGYGRIYVHDPNKIMQVKDKIKEINEFEYDYLPSGFVTSFEDFPNVVYTHKFDDLDTDELTLKCWRAGIFIFCFDNGHKEYVTDNLLD